MSAFLAALVVSLFCMAELWLAGAAPSALTFILLAGGAWATLVPGYALLRYAAGNVDSRFGPSLHLALVLGTVAANLIVIALINLASISAGRAFSYVAASVALLALLSTVSSGIPSFSGIRDRLFRIDRSGLADIGQLAILCLVVIAWSRQQAQAFPSLQASGVAPVWLDVFLHAYQIAQYSRVDGLARGSIILVGEPVELYHRAIFALPAAISQLAHVSALVATTALLLPLGLLVCLAGVAALGNTLAQDRVTGLLAAMLLVALPDAARYGLQNGFFSFTWLMFASPGTGWSVGISAAALAHCCRWLEGRRAGELAVAIALALALFWHRANVLVLFAPGLALLVLGSFRRPDPFRPRRLKVFRLVAVIVLAAGIAAWTFPATRAYWLGFSAVDEFLMLVHGGFMEPTAYGGFYGEMIARYGPKIAVPVGIVLTLVAAFGLLLVAWPVLAWAARRNGGVHPIDAIPLLLLVSFIAIVMVAPATGFGRVDEYQHRAFPLVYAVLLTYCVAYASLFVRRRGARLAASRLAFPAALAFVALALGATLLWGGDLSRPIFKWGEQLYPVRVDPSLLRIGGYLYAHVGDGDVFAVVPPEPDALAEDVGTKVIALSGATAYLARAASPDARNRGTIAERLAYLDAVAVAGSRSAAFELMRGRGISWLVTRKRGALRWDPEGRSADFREGDFAIYRRTR